MSTILQTLASLAAAGTMLFSAPVDQAAPQHDENGLLFLINRQYRVSESYQPELRMADVTGQVRRMRPDASYALEKMFAACREETGKTLKSVSGFRSYDTQANIYNSRVKRSSVEKADQYVARPGASEHQMGLAMDVGQKSDDVNLTASFGRTTGGKWVRENCWRFGFILRYDEGWEDITGYNYEPWHVRYVGEEHAEKIHEANEPLETYLQTFRGETLLSIVTGEIIED